MLRAAASLVSVGALVAALAGCAGPGDPRPPVQAQVPDPTAAAAPPAATPTVALPTLCGSPEPAPRDPFPYNRDAGRRDSMLHISGSAAYTGGIAYFEDLDVTGLAALFEARFVDPFDQQNAAPTAWQILQFLCDHPQVRTAGYAVSGDRDDYRTSLETVYAVAIDANLRAAAETFCVDADAVETGDHLECYWD
ncbi:hypothetical protein SAMN05421812_101695 [Asanoa hainanensis]|uniref:Lipoprotein n=1 Tax=Asanoa hainanensis TaxID=560556 RepID=A0A239H591_9ACTN|nr:hypothetical protein [Asanoa hainanensis]SNS76341.1 hypothetical protein SAMN05421812_101695 [Asanoa hainanensis]